MAEPKSRYNAKEAARMLGLHEEQVRRLCRAEKIGRREGGAWVIYRYEIAARMGATPRDVEQIRRLDLAAALGTDILSALVHEESVA